MPLSPMYFFFRRSLLHSCWSSVVYFQRHGLGGTLWRPAQSPNAEVKACAEFGHPEILTCTEGTLHVHMWCMWCDIFLYILYFVYTQTSPAVFAHLLMNYKSRNANDPYIMNISFLGIPSHHQYLASPVEHLRWVSISL